jgi:protein-S-isoprenylcysteine O-methyltransferase Ste14
VTTQNPLSSLRLVLTALYLLLWPGLVFLLAGNWHWLEGWLFAAWFLSLSGGTVAWLYRKDPALLAERFRKPGSGGEKRWDQVVVYGLVLGFAAWIAIMPLDAQRFGWTHLPRWLEALGGAMLLLSAFLLFRAFADNTFLSPLVRVQAERQQRVVSTGVYGVVRHPMYLGGALLFLGTPLLLGSALGLLIGAVITLLLAARVVGEERLLVAELEGYEDYRKKVRYRLVPFLW